MIVRAMDRSVRTYLLRRVLASLRDDLTFAQAGRATGVPASTIQRYETGATIPEPSRVELLADGYGVTGEKRDRLRELAQQADSGDRVPYRSVAPDWFRFMLDLEIHASVVRVFEPSILPGSLQTERSAWAIMSSGPRPPSGSELAARVEGRMTRAARILDSSDTSFTAIIAEGALWRRMGSREDHLQQLVHLRTLAAHPHLEIRILESTTTHPGVRPFSLFRLPPPESLEIAYEEHQTGALYPDAPDQVAAYQEQFDHLLGLCAPVSETPSLIRKVESRL